MSKRGSTSQKYSWENGPMSLIPTPASETGHTDQFTSSASEMALVHNCIIRALNSIYIQAPHVPSTEYVNFVPYCLATYQGLTAHHDGEEEFLFKELEKMTGEEGIMEANVQGHRDFDTIFEEWGHWLESCAAKSDNFSPDKCRSMMDGFMPPLSAHLAAEIPTLMALSRFGDKVDLQGLMKKEGEIAMGGMSKTTQLPLFLLNHDTTFESGIHTFPPVPAPVRFLLRSVFGRWQSQWWQFSTCGFDGLPRELKFLESQVTPAK
ncbi:hypothetical protein BKA66DRAFT_414180 [Pyrenochaeta sp. MPI-SDFR-AT-0127]|nr:hypothetical protein BKA66DRAFT_414180 [Pyrenochaeta sp. MPI-SDFR-AT-0127]